MNYEFILIQHFSITISIYSLLKLFTGFATAALIAWKTTVINAMSKAVKPATINIHHEI